METSCHGAASFQTERSVHEGRPMPIRTPWRIWPTPRKRTGFATNSPEIAKALDALCPGDHQHEVIIGGTKSKKAQIYPEGLREAILAAYARSIGAEVYTITSEQMFLENDRLNSLLAVELMVDSELHPGHSPDRDQGTTLCAPQVPGHELHLSEVDPDRPDQVESVLPGPTWELHAEELQGDGDQGEHEPESDERTFKCSTTS